MCVSFEASLIAGSGLAALGVGSVVKARRNDPSLLLFACFPLVFSVHQFVEAVVWLSVAHPFSGQEAFRYLYTMIAFLVWPILTPAAAAYADPQRRKIWTSLCGLGVALSLYLSLKLALADGIDLRVSQHALAYDPLFETPPIIADLLYLALAVIPLVAQRQRALNLFGWSVFVSFVYSIVENRPAWYSLWCFTAAVFSALIIFAIRDRVDSRAFDEAKA